MCIFRIKLVDTNSFRGERIPRTSVHRHEKMKDSHPGTLAVLTC